MKTELTKHQWKEVFDNVVCVHTGKYYDCGRVMEQIDFYDKDGNCFYTNKDGIESAERTVSELRNQGKHAIIGSKAPWRDNTPSGLIPNRSNTDVGIYIVEDSFEKA